MKETRAGAAFTLSFIGAILIILNGSMIISNGAPVLLQVYHGNDFWSRISFGIKGLVEGLSGIFWMIFAIAMLVGSIRIYLKPRMQKVLGLPIVLFSILTIPIGGGFVLGSILGFIGGALGIEWPKPFGDTFLGKMIRAARLDSKLYRVVTDNPLHMRTAAIVVIFTSLLSGLGNSLYTFNLHKINTGTSSEAFEIIQRGAMLWDIPMAITSISYIGVAFIKWLILTLSIYIVGVKLMACSSEFDKIARAIAFTYVPICFQVFLPLMLSNEPSVSSYNWPMTIFFLTNLWMILALVVSTKEALDISVRRATGVVALGGTLYWLLNNLFIIPSLELPGIRFELALPASLPVLLLLITFASILATLLGVFSRR